jgi:hypothetical protein
MICQAASKAIGKSGLEVAVERKVLRLMHSTELGCDDAMIQLITGEKEVADLVSSLFGSVEDKRVALDQDRALSDFKSDLLACISMLNLDLRQTIAINIDLKLEFFQQQQTYQHMQVIQCPQKQQEQELCKYFRLMVAKVLLHIRTGQAGHVYDIFVSLFDIVRDPEILGVKLMTKRPYKFKKPDLFGYKEDLILSYLK